MNSSHPVNYLVDNSEKVLTHVYFQQLISKLEECFDINFFQFSRISPANQRSYIGQCRQDINDINVFLTQHPGDPLPIEAIEDFLKKRWDKIKNNTQFRYVPVLEQIQNPSNRTYYSSPKFFKPNEWFVELARLLLANKQQRLIKNNNLLATKILAFKKNKFIVAKVNEHLLAVKIIHNSSLAATEKQIRYQALLNNIGLAEELAQIHELPYDLAEKIKQNVITKILRQKYNFSQVVLTDDEQNQCEEEAARDNQAETSNAFSVYQLLMPTINNDQTLENSPIDSFGLEQFILDDGHQYLLYRPDMAKIYQGRFLKHPYLQRNLSDNELSALREDLNIRKDLYAKESQFMSVVGYITRQTINELILLAQGLSFQEGGVRNYFHEETQLVAEAVDRFDHYFQRLSVEEQAYIKHYQIEHESRHRPFIDIYNDLTERNICSYNCGIWFCKFIYDHRPSTVFKEHLYNRTTKTFSLVNSNDLNSFKFFWFVQSASSNPNRTRTRTRIRSKVRAAVEKFFRQHGKKILIGALLTSSLALAITFSLLLCGVPMPFFGWAGATMLSWLGVANTAWSWALGAGVIASVSGTIIGGLVGLTTSLISNQCKPRLQRAPLTTTNQALPASPQRMMRSASQPNLSVPTSPTISRVKVNKPIRRCCGLFAFTRKKEKKPEQRPNLSYTR